jgi:hypothetical protein
MCLQKCHFPEIAESGMSVAAVLAVALVRDGHLGAVERPLLTVVEFGANAGLIRDSFSCSLNAVFPCLKMRVHLCFRYCKFLSYI